MSKIKMVALDLDGTTLNSNKEITPRTVQAFQKAMDKGVHIVVSTGRTYNSLPKQLFKIPGLEYVVTSNGAHITKLSPREKIYENYLDKKAVEEIVSIMSKTNYSIETFVDGNAYIDSMELSTILEEGSSYRDVEYIKETRNPINNIYGFILDHKDEIENISLNFEFENEKEKMMSILKNVKNITLTSSFNHNIEIGGATTSKGQALKYLMDKLNIHKGQLMACGDSPNDGQMLKLAAIGVVVENGTEEMKAIADYVTDTNNNDGVAKAIEKFVL